MLLAAVAAIADAIAGSAKRCVVGTLTPKVFPDRVLLSFVGTEEEQFVFHDRTAERAAPLLQVHGGVLGVADGVEIVARVEGASRPKASRCRE